MSGSEAGYERSDVNIRNVIGIAVVLTGFLFATLIFLNHFFSYSKEKMVYERVLNTQSAELRRLRVVENEKLDSYRILNQQTGQYQIPVSLAMKLIADESYRK